MINIEYNVRVKFDREIVSAGCLVNMIDEIEILCEEEGYRVSIYAERVGWELFVAIHNDTEYQHVVDIVNDELEYKYPDLDREGLIIEVESPEFFKNGKVKKSIIHRASKPKVYPPLRLVS